MFTGKSSKALQTQQSLLVSGLTVLLAASLISCQAFVNPISEKGAEAERGNSILGPGRSFAVGFDPNSGPFTDSKMLANIGLNVFAPAYEDLWRSSVRLREALDVACGSGTRAEARIEDSSWRRAQTRWEDAMRAYHRAAALDLGPILQERELYESRVNSCEVDIRLARQVLGDGDAQPLGVEAPREMGLGAVEYLLHESRGVTECARRNAFNRAAFTWSDQPEGVRRLQRCQRALTLSRRIEDATQRLWREWNPREGNHTRSWVDGSRFPQSQQAVAFLAEKLLEVERVKDDRIGRPLGLQRDCADSSGKCPQDREHRWSEMGLQAARERLVMVRDVFRGSGSSSGPGFGFDDLFFSMGQGGRASQLLLELEGVIAQIDQLSAPFGSVIQEMDPVACRSSTRENPLVPLCGWHHRLTLFTREFKSSLLSVLSTVRAPPGFHRDND